MASETYEFLQEIIKTGETNRWNAPEYIRDIIANKNPSSTKIIIAFENDNDFLETLGIVDDDDRYVWSRFSGNYNNESYDGERYHDDWEEGYVLESFSDENTEKVKYILRIVDPTLTLVRGDNDEKISKIFTNKFPNEVNDIIYEYGKENRECIAREVKKILVNETKNPFVRFGIIEKDWSWRFETTVSVLLNWYRMLKAEDDNIKDLLKKLIEKYQPNSNRGDWYELEYDVFCGDYDKESFNYEAGRSLDHMIDSLNESMSNNENYEDYLKMLDVIANLGGFNTWIMLEKENRKIRFLSIDSMTNLLKFQITGKGGDYGKKEARSVSTLEDLNTTLYHPELFEHLKKTIEKIL